MMNYSHCLEKAGDICGNIGYVVVNQLGEAVPSSSAFQAPSGGFLARNCSIC